MNIETIKQNFEDFQIQIPTFINELKYLFFESVKYSKYLVNYSLDTINYVENFYIDVRNNKEEIPFSKDHFRNIITAYLGEALIHHAGGEWQLCLNTDDPDYGLPHIKGFKYDSDGIGYSPIGQIEKLDREKITGVFKESIDFCINKDDLLEDEFKKFNEMINKNKK